MKEIVLDIETTGLEFKHGDKIIEIACVELSNFLPTGKTFQKYCNPQKKVGESIKIHDLKDELLKKKFCSISIFFSCFITANKLFFFC